MVLKNNCKKYLIIGLVMSLALSLVGCGANKVSDEDKVDVLLITDMGTVNDGSFNQGAWEGITRYANETGVIAKYYQPEGTTTEDYLEQIKLGISNGAQVIVCPGYLFEETIYKAQSKYPDTHFILLDGSPHDKDYKDETIKDNVMPIHFAEEEAGFLAGYAAVRDGYTDLAFMGGVPENPIIRFGYGFVQGADYASVEMGIPIYVRYTYTNTFYEDDSVEATAASWYDSGTQVIFACGGAMGRSVMRAAENHNGKVIGVDVDQHSESDTVITSAMKSLDTAVYSGVKAHFDQTFPGGSNVVFSAKEDGVELPMDTSRFTRFSQDDYNAIIGLLVDEVIEPYANTDIGTCEELSLINTEVSYIVP